MTNVDLTLTVRLFNFPDTFDQGAQAFLDWLRALKSVPMCDVAWGTQFEKDGPKIPLEPDVSAYVERYRPDVHEPVVGFSIRAHEASDPHLFTAELKWGAYPPRFASIRFYRADPRFGTDPAQYIEMIRISSACQRPQHLDFGPTLYRMFDHPLDRSRHGIGWMGWLPFALTPADVPEAHLVMPMNGGTFIQSVPDFWQAPHLPRQPDAVRDEATIARVQDVEIRLNLLGVLPTADDLRGGNWGR